MPNHIHTIPVLDALREPQSCAFCVMHQRLEEDAIQFILGPAYMEDDVRMDTNRVGFCNAHLSAMYTQQNRLGLAFMLHTHLQQLNKDVSSILENKKPSPLFGKDPNEPLSKIHAHLDKTIISCYVCTKVEATFDRYVGTFFMLWANGGPEVQLIRSQKSYCLHHFTVMLLYAGKLGSKKRKEFMAEILPVWQNFMKELETDLDWFTQKFDHRNKDEPWKNSKDVLPRALAILGGDAYENA